MMKKGSQSFWAIDADSKLDILVEPRHLPLILCALEDPDTRVDSVDAARFIVYGPNEALTIVATSWLGRWALSILCAFCHIAYPLPEWNIRPGVDQMQWQSS